MSVDESKLRFSFNYVKAVLKEGKITGLNESTIKGQHVIVLEGVYDTGKSMSIMSEHLKGLLPLSLKTAVLFMKRNPDNLSYKFKPDYLGFTIPPKYVVGYHLDYMQMFREIPHLCIVNEEEAAKLLKKP